MRLITAVIVLVGAVLVLLWQVFRAQPSLVLVVCATIVGLLALMAISDFGVPRPYDWHRDGL